MVTVSMMPGISRSLIGSTTSDMSSSTPRAAQVAEVWKS
jgi:hypothetical protein